MQHHSLIPLPRIQLHQLLEVGEKLSALLELLIHVVNGIVEGDIGIVESPDLFGRERRLDKLRTKHSHDEVHVVCDGLFANRRLDRLI